MGAAVDEYDDYDDPNEAIYLLIRDDLYARYPLAAFGPGHVCLDDKNWDTFAWCIKLTNCVLAWRALRVLGLQEQAAQVEQVFALESRMSPSDYDSHSTEEIAATLAALELIKWHEEGAQGDAPQK